MDADGPQTGRILGREEPEAPRLQCVVRVHGRPGRLRRPATTSSTTGRSRPRTGTRSRTPATTGCSTTASRRTRSSMEAGATRLGIEHFGPLVTRGLLCDVARLKGVEWFDEPYAITGADLDACVDAARAAGRGRRRRARPHRADALAARRATGTATPTSRRASAWTRSSGCTTTTSPRSRPTRTRLRAVPGRRVANPFLFPVHMIELRDMGMPQGQQWASRRAGGGLRGRRRLRVPPRGHAAAGHPREWRPRRADGDEMNAALRFGVEATK